MKERIARIACVVGLGLIATYAAVTWPKGIASLYAKEREIQAVEKQNAALAKENDNEQRKVDEIGSDPAERERVVEERLNLVHPGDKVYRLPDSKKK